MNFAICNEMFEGWPHPKVAATVAGLGYRGTELAPFTLGASPLETPAAERRAVRSAFADAGAPVIGLHWLLAKTEGLSVTSPDPVTADRTIGYLRGLVSLCRDL